MIELGDFAVYDPLAQLRHAVGRLRRRIKAGQEKRAPGGIISPILATWRILTWG